MIVYGTRSVVFESGKCNVAENFRGITILPVTEKIEAAVYKHIVFVNETFEFCDRYNSGFLEGSRTSDNLFTLNGQLIMNKRLNVCYIDFSKAFDMINRNI